MNRQHRAALIPIRYSVAAALLSCSVETFACASCGGMLSSDWGGQGFAVGPGWRADLRHDFVDQKQLRTGTGTVERNAYPAPAEREIELRTINRYTTLTLDYAANPDWGVSVQLPFVSRTHTTIAEGDEQVSGSRSNSLGDIRLLGRYQGLTPARNVGFQFGVKLPTGDFRRPFSFGAQAGEPLDRGLQPGTGTTDALIGAYHFNSLNRDWDYFALGLAQFALNSRENYRPGDALNFNAGMRYMSLDVPVVPQLQINLRYSRADRGDEADIANSGGTTIQISPGATWALAQKLWFYGFLQLPVYQNLRGFQLAPRWTVSAGLRFEL